MRISPPVSIVHLTLASLSRRPIAPTESVRRAVVRCLGRVLAERVLLFAVVDDHLHVVVYATEDDARRLANGLLLALRSLSDVELGPPHLAPVRDRSHLTNLVRYLLQQPLHHRLLQHPALVSGSCYADLVGARTVPGLALGVFRELPRLALADLAPLVGLPRRELEPVAPADVRALGAFRLVAAAAFAVAADPCGEGNEREPTVARRAAARLAVEAGLDTGDLAAALGVARGTPARLSAREVDGTVLSAVRLRLALEAEVAQSCERAAVRAMCDAVQRREAPVPEAWLG